MRCNSCGMRRRARAARFSHTKFLFCAAVLASLAQVHAQDIVAALPAPDSGNSGVSLFAARNLAPGGAVQARQGAVEAFMSPDGSRVYILSTWRDDSWLTVATPSGEVLSSGIWIGPAARDVQRTPDGKGFVTLSGNMLFEREFVGDKLETPVSIWVGPAPAAAGVSPDGSTIYILDASNARLTAAGATSLQMQATQIPQNATALAAGPNGLIYISSEGRLTEADVPDSFGGVQIRRSIELPEGFRPGRPEFTPDGRKLIVLNEASLGAPGAICDISDGRVHEFPDTGLRFSGLAVAGNEYAFAVGTDGKLYAITLESAKVEGPLFGLPGNVKSIAVSKETPRARSLFVLTAGDSGAATLTRVDLDTFATISAPAGAASKIVYLAAVSTGPAAALYGVDTLWTVAPGQSAPVAVRVVDANGRAVAGAPVAWSAPVALTARTPEMGSTNAAGNAAAGYTASYTYGTQRVAAAAGGRQLDFSVVISDPRARDDGAGGDLRRVSIVSGQGQLVREFSHAAGPLTVRVLGEDGLPLNGAQVVWSIENATEDQAALDFPACTGTATVRTCRTDQNGMSSIVFTARAIGSLVPLGVKITATASLEGKIAGNAVFHATILPPKAPVSFEIDTGGVTAFSLSRGQPLDGAMQFRVLAGNEPVPIANAGITVSSAIAGLNVHCIGGTVLTDASGEAECTLVGSGSLGSSALVIDLGGQSQDAGLSATVSAGPPGRIVKIAGDGQYGEPGDSLPAKLEASVRDGARFPLPGAAVTWEVIQGDASLSAAQSTADDKGNVTASVKLGLKRGPVTVRVRAENAWADFSLSNEPVSALEKTSGDGQFAQPGGVFAPLIVRVTGPGGVLAGARVDFSVTSGNATLWASSVNTAADGTAAVVVSAGDELGPVKVTASAAGESVAFTLEVSNRPVLAASSFVNGASFEPGISPGAIVSVFSNALLPGAPPLEVGECVSGYASTGGFPATLGGVQVQFGAAAAPILAVCRTSASQHQINIQMPFEVRPGTVDAVVRTGAGGGSPEEITVNGLNVAQASPGIFQTVLEGRVIATAVHQDGSLVSPSKPAARGETVWVFATGLGPLTESVAGAEAPAYTPVVKLGGSGVSGVATMYASTGVFGISFTVPANGPVGSVQLQISVVTDADEVIDGPPAILPVQ